MAEPTDLVVPLLRDMRSAADSLPSKLLTGEFEERIEALEKNVQDLETMK